MTSCWGHHVAVLAVEHMVQGDRERVSESKRECESD